LVIDWQRTNLPLPSNSQSPKEKMNWKDFLYFHRGEQVAITLLLVLITLAILLNMTICSRSVSDIALLQNDSVAVQFNEFRESLQEREIPVVQRETERNDIRRDEARLVSTINQNRTEQRIIAERPSAENRTENRQNDFPRTEKLAEGETIFLSTTDAAEWQKIPGIGSTFADRIVRYKNRLGGFSSVYQLREVNGIDDELFARVSPFIEHNTNIKKLQINRLEFRELLAHPYLEYEQVQVIMNLRRRTGNISSIEELAMLSEFSNTDIERLRAYLAF
jgi:DNA uptake protein ComE-like DNA-binding protein